VRLGACPLFYMSMLALMLEKAVIKAWWDVWLVLLKWIVMTCQKSGQVSKFVIEQCGSRGQKSEIIDGSQMAIRKAVNKISGDT